MARPAKAPSVQRDLQKDMAAAATLKAQLKDILGAAELDADTLKDSIEGETGLFETIDAVIGQIGMDMSRIDGLKAFASSLESRRSRLEARCDTLRTMLMNCLDILEEKRFERPLATITLKDVAPKLVVVDEGLVPSDYFEVSDPVLSRKKLGDALKARAAALDELEAEREAAGATMEQAQYRDKLKAILEQHPSIPGAELGNGSRAVQIRFS